MIGLVVALKDEAQNVIDEFGLLPSEKIAGKKVYQGVIRDKKVVLIVCGVGKVSAALATQAVIDAYGVTKILNFGTAGGANESVSALSIYLVDKCCQYDFDLSELDGCGVGYMCDYDTTFYPCEVANINVYPKKSLCTADRFSNKAEDIRTVNALGCSLRDMEGAAIAQVAISNGIPFISLKGVTDTYLNPAKQFYENKAKVCASFPKAVSEVLALL